MRQFSPLKMSAVLIYQCSLEKIFHNLSFLPDFLRSSGSGTGPTQPRELLEKKKKVVPLV
jgi:hypothetical protein